MSKPPKDIHLTSEELLCAADGELTPKRDQEVRAHLASCWSCRTRMADLERTITDFVRLHENTEAPGSPDAGRALLKAHLNQLSAADAKPSLWSLARRYQTPLVAFVAFAIATPTAFLLSRRSDPPAIESRATPDPHLTPGVVLPVTASDVCTDGAVETAHIVSPAIAKAVFASYGIDRPQPGAYEVDYLITPALGGSDNVHNFWPQSYRETVWNAHIKDALEDHLHSLVCRGELELATAQQDIAKDWVTAYKKYFRTDHPLPEHISFLKDRPWE